MTSSSSDSESEDSHHDDSDWSHASDEVNNLNDSDENDNEDEGDGSAQEDEDREADENRDSDDSDNMEYEENDDMFMHGLGHRPLYRGAWLTVAESVTAVMAFMVNHSIDMQCVEDLFKLIQLHCPQEGFVKQSLYKLKKYCSFTTGPMKKHYYCEVCSQALPEAQAVCPVCNRRRRVSYFVQTPIIPQLKKMYSRPTFHNSLQNRFTRQRLNVDCLEDIYDGSVYREQVHNGFLANPNNFSMTYFVDGVPVFKSKNFSFWGFFLTINELPYRERVKRENTLLAGLWLGRKPHTNLFMSSFVSDFRKLYSGVNIHCEGTGQIIRVRGIVLAGVADTPARSSFMNCMHHNSFFGCVLCEIEGVTVRLPSGNDTHAYRYQRELPKRTVERMLEQARQAVAISDPVRGVKGPTALRLFIPNYLKGTGIDIMHLASGLMKKLIALLFDSKFSAFEFSLRVVISAVNRYLLEIKPPKFIHRFPRKIEDWKHWKASELLAFLFYYSVVIFKEVMRPEYYDHYMKLVVALSFLSSPSISLDMIEKADELLHEFVRDFQILYGLRHCSINVHMLLHLADCVRFLGPLFVYGCFGYENINGEMLRDIHGKTNVDSQIVRMHWQVLGLPKKLHLLRDGAVKDYCLRRRGQLKICERLHQSCYVVGTYKEREINNPLITQGLQTSNVQYRNVKPFFRLLKDELVYVSESYTRALRSNSSYVAYRRGNMKCYGCVHIFVKVLLCECGFDCNCGGTFYAIIRGTEKVSNVSLFDHHDTHLPHMHRCRTTLDVYAVPIRDLITVCIFMHVHDKTYLAEPVNQSKNE